MKKQIASILILVSLLLFANLVYAKEICEENEKCLDIEFKVSTIPVREMGLRVVDDTFYYNITLFNNGSSTINSNFLVQVYGPNDEIISSEAGSFSNRIIEAGQKIELTQNKSATEVTIYPLDISGDYKISVSSQNIVFYRRFAEGGYAYFPKNINYSFDVMPRYQYELWKKEEKASQKILDINTETLNLNKEVIDYNKEMRDYNKYLIGFTIALIILAFLQLIASRGGRRILLLTIMLSFVLILIFFSIGLLFSEGIGKAKYTLSFIFLIGGISCIWIFRSLLKESEELSREHKSIY